MGVDLGDMGLIGGFGPAGNIMTEPLGDMGSLSIDTRFIDSFGFPNDPIVGFDFVRL